MKATVLQVFKIASLAFLAIILSSCTSNETMKSGDPETDKVLKFYKYEDGYKSLYEVGFKDNKIVSLYKDGKKIPDAETGNYEKLVYENLDELKSSNPDGDDVLSRHFTIRKDKFKQMEKGLQKDKLFWIEKDPVKEKRIYMLGDKDSLLELDEDDDMHIFKFKLDDLDDDILHFKMDKPGRKKFFMFNDSDSCCTKGSMHYFDFNWDEFNDNMKNLKKDMKDKQVYIFKHMDSLFCDSSFKNDMKKMKVELQKMKDHKVKVMIDSDNLKTLKEKIKVKLSDENLNKHMKELNVRIRKMTDDLKDMDMDLDEIDIDIPEIEIELENLEDKLSDLNENSAELKIEMKKLNGFTKEAKKELLKDGIIKSEDENFSFSLDNEKIKVNDKDLPEGLQKKYRDLYTKHLGKVPGKKMHIQINKD